MLIPTAYFIFICFHTKTYYFSFDTICVCSSLPPFFAQHFLHSFVCTALLDVTADTNNIRNKTRTPNIFKNVDRPLPSPTSTSMKLNESAPMSPALSPNTKSMISQKVQTLKQRKQDLDKLLIEKNSLLQQLCREEAKIIGCSTYSLNDVANISGIDCGDGGVNNGCDRLQLNNNNSTLRRHIDTGFKLPENLLNSNEDDINQLMLSKKIQQQISQASLKLANDLNQTKVSATLDYLFQLKSILSAIESTTVILANPSSN